MTNRPAASDRGDDLAYDCRICGSGPTFYKESARCRVCSNCGPEGRSERMRPRFAMRTIHAPNGVSCITRLVVTADFEDGQSWYSWVDLANPVTTVKLMVALQQITDNLRHDDALGL